MSDGIAPAIDKVGAPAPSAPEADAHAPTLDTTNPPSIDKPEGNKSEEKELERKTQETSLDEAKKPEDSTKLSVTAPKPVEAMSVPETPINNSTPAGGTPRPELNISDEPAPPKEDVDVPMVMTGVQEPLPTPTTSAPKDADPPNSNMSAEASLDKNAGPSDTKIPDVLKSETIDSSASKRKLDEAKPTINGETATAQEQKDQTDEPVEKKAKVENGDAVVPETNGNSDASSGNGNGNGKVGRPKKEKKASPPVGKTARKTRSQGPVEV